jgi:hypothetical protein
MRHGADAPSDESVARARQLNAVKLRDTSRVRSQLVTTASATVVTDIRAAA